MNTPRLFIFALGFFLPFGPSPAKAADRTENVILITADGLRWQEVFSGAEAQLISRNPGGVANTNRLHREFWRETSEERREALMPFFWKVIAKRGQLYGNQTKGSTALVTNGRNFSFPGYSEILAGFADDRITSNDKRPNPNVTVLEWLHDKPEFRGRVAGFGSWDVHPYIVNHKRSGIPVWTGHEDPIDSDPNSRHGIIDEMMRDITPAWQGVRFDVFTFHHALTYLKEKQPRLLFLSLGETDEWSHEGRYDLYLYSARQFDAYVQKLWETLQNLPQYRNKTSLVITTDHGRGSGPVEWKNHGAAVPGADGIWVALLGPEISSLGERGPAPVIYQNQVAATVAALLGFDYHGAVPKAGAPLPFAQ